MHKQMTHRKRCLETILFGNPDRIPLTPGRGRDSTRAAWYSQGLPENIEPAQISEYAYRQAGGQLPWPEPGNDFSVNERMIPQFEEKIIERKETSQIVQDWKGNICEISNDYTIEHLRKAIDFVTRRWLKCPVENQADWDNMKQRYDADLPSRLPENPAVAGKAATESAGFIEINFPGPFWQLREWLGFEELCMMFYDQPALVADMIEFWQEYIARLMERIFEYTILDSIHISEDMAYKNFSMISPAMIRKHLLPVYKRWGEVIRRAGVPIYAVDSDGYIGEIIPIWLEAGVNACDPIEVAAGNDIVAFRKQFGREMAFRGGVDKRAMAKGGSVIEQEIERIRPVIDDGGFIPSCDHGVPADVSWPNFLHYTKLLATATGWL